MLQDITNLRERSDEITTSIRDIAVCCLVILVFVCLWPPIIVETLLEALSLSPTTDNTQNRPR